MNLTRLRYACIISFPLLIFLLYLWMALLSDLRLTVPEWIGASAVVVILLSMTVYWSQQTGTCWSSGFIILMSVIFRAMFLWRTPELSDDIYRYLFDGLMLLSGINPYGAAPAEMPVDNLFMSSLIPFINHADLPTIYPPAAQLVFATGAFSGGIIGMKLFFIILDSLSCILIVRLLAALGLPRNCAVLYAWHPLPVIEVAASGHMDAAAIFFSFASLVFLLAKKQNILTDKLIGKKNTLIHYKVKSDSIRGFFAGVFFAAAVLSKWVPLIFLSGWWMLTTPGNRKYAISGFMGCFIAMMALFWPEVLNCFHTLSVYVANWEFSGFAFRWLRFATGSGAITRLALTAAFMIATLFIYFRYSKSDNQIDVFKSFYAIAMTFLFLTPTLHPWYALYLAAFLPFAAGPAGIAFSWSVFLAYRVVILYGLTGQWVENDFIPFLIVSAPAAAFVASVIIGKAKRKGTYPAKNFH